MVDLRAVGPEGERLFGGKARGLARLIEAGARVPDGFAVEASRHPPTAWPKRDRAEFESRVAGLLQQGPLAVRSSAVGEDSASRSFAGLFETVLHVRDVAAASEAAARCVASAGADRVLAYAGEAPAVGLVVQAQVAARAAGVCFTVDPSGRDRAVVIEAVAGLGDALVSGRAKPEAWRAYRSGLGVWEALRQPGVPGTTLTPREAAGIAAAGVGLAESFGHPLDLEWALDAQGLCWLQARPITAATAPREWVVERAAQNVDDGPVTVWSNHNVRETLPDAFPPLTWTLWRDVILPVVTEDLIGVPGGTPLGRQVAGIDLVHGRVYWNMNALLAWPLGSLLFLSMRLIDARATRSLEQLRAAGVLGPRRLPASATRLRAGLLRATLQAFARLAGAFRPRRTLARLEAAGRAMASRPPVGTLDDRELLRELRLLGEPEAEGFRRAMQALVASLLVYQAADRAFRPYPEARRRLPVGIRGNPTTEISLGVAQLAEAARPLAAEFRDPLSASLLRERLAPTPEGRAWLEGLDAFLARFGQRCPREFDIAAPRWAEDPGMVLGLVQAGLASSGEPLEARMVRLAAERTAAIEAAVAAAPFWRRPLLARLARAVELFLPLREAPKHYAMFLFQRMRGAALELGARLAARGTIEHAGDVFMLEWPELGRLALGEPAASDLRAVVAERRSRLERYRRDKPPDILRSDGVPVIEDLEPAGDGLLHGTGVSPGRGRGPVRILREPDPRALGEGEVMVVEFADPGWTPLFPRARAIVMEVGGTLCHAAVVARELGIPAVFGVAAATARLSDGQVVSVDGEAGTVTPEAGKASERLTGRPATPDSPAP
jgi:pyruvate,water dikinase